MMRWRRQRTEARLARYSVRRGGLRPNKPIPTPPQNLRAVLSADDTSAGTKLVKVLAMCAEGMPDKILKNPAQRLVITFELKEYDGEAMRYRVKETPIVIELRP